MPERLALEGSQSSVATRFMMRKRPQGVVLLWVAIVLSLLLMLTGAFLQVHRTHFGLVNTTQARDDAYATCKGVYSYILYRLEHDRNWGAAPFEGGVDKKLASDLKVVELQGLSTISGSMPALSTDFTAEILNNLNNTSSDSNGVPPESARLVITATSRGCQQQLEVLLHVAPLFDSSALSRASLVVDANRLDIRSRDPYRNLVRAEGEVRMPDVLTSARTRFLLPDSQEADSRGVVSSRKEILTTSGGGYSELEHANLQLANQNSGGQFLPGSNKHFEIFDLQSKDLILPPETSSIGSGEYRFTKATARITHETDVESRVDKSEWKQDSVPARGVHTQDIDVLEYYANPDDDVPTAVYRSKTRQDFTVSVPSGKRKTGATRVVDVSIDYSFTGTPKKISAHTADRVPLDKAGTVMADLLNQTVTINPGTTVETQGDLKITSSRGTPPRLVMGTPENPPALVAGGSLHLQNANTAGLGTLIAKNGDVKVRPLTQDMSVNANEKHAGLVVYASNDVEFINPNPGAGNLWEFHGLVYARNNFRFDGNGADALIDGTVVAKVDSGDPYGGLFFNDCGDVDFIYNPDYMNLMVKDLPHNRLQLELLRWQE